MLNVFSFFVIYLIQRVNSLCIIQLFIQTKDFKKICLTNQPIKITLNKKSSKFFLPNTTPPVLKGLYMGMGIEIIDSLSKIPPDFLNTFH